eukprot:1818492-Heterocapsa_arctica.AAC.1
MRLGSTGILVAETTRPTSGSQTTSRRCTSLRVGGSSSLALEAREPERHIPGVFNEVADYREQQARAAGAQQGEHREAE